MVSQQSKDADFDDVDVEPRGEVAEFVLSLFTKHGDALFGFARARVTDCAAAEDLVQETFVAAVAYLNSGEPLQAPKAWLYSVIRRKIADHRRLQFKQARIVSRIANLPSGEDSSRLKSTANDTNLELASAIEECLDQLPIAMRQAFHLRVIEQCEVDVSAERLGVSTGAVSARLYRARISIRDCLQSFFN